MKAPRVHLVDTWHPDANVSHPTDRRYWLVVVRNPLIQGINYFVSNELSHTDIKKLMAIGFAQWPVQKWFQRAKPETGFGVFEVRMCKS